MTAGVSTSEISPKLPLCLVDLFRQAGIAPERLLQNLPFDEQELREARRVRWDDYCVIVERGGAILGAAGVETMCAEGLHALAFQTAALASASTCPSSFYRMVVEVLGPTHLPNMEFQYEDRGEGRLRLGAALRSDDRPCAAHFWMLTGAFRGLPRHLGFPEAQVTVEDLDGRRASWQVLVPTPSSPARAPVPAASFRKVALQALEQSAELLRQQAQALAVAKHCIAEQAAQLATIQRIGRELAAGARLDELVPSLARLLCVELGWHEVRVWLRAPDGALRLAHEERGDGPVEARRVVPLSTGGRTIGRLELGAREGAVATDALDELAPWIALALEEAHGRARAPALDDEQLARALERAAATHQLTPRQGEVLAQLVSGYANKEIAVNLDCAENTIELHVSQLLRKMGAQSRLQLVTRFWSGLLGR